jgi:hypothetical protein
MITMLTPPTNILVSFDDLESRLPIVVLTSGTDIFAVLPSSTSLRFYLIEKDSKAEISKFKNNLLCVNNMSCNKSLPSRCVIYVF